MSGILPDNSFFLSSSSRSHLARDGRNIPGQQTNVHGSRTRQGTPANTIHVSVAPNTDKLFSPRKTLFIYVLAIVVTSSLHYYNNVCCCVSVYLSLSVFLGRGPQSSSEDAIELSDVSQFGSRPAAAVSRRGGFAYLDRVISLSLDPNL